MSGLVKAEARSRPTQSGRFPPLRDGPLYGTLVHMIKEKIRELQKLSPADKFALAVGLWEEFSSSSPNSRKTAVTLSR
jgi:hypothetical protein